MKFLFLIFYFCFLHFLNAQNRIILNSANLDSNFRQTNNLRAKKDGFSPFDYLRPEVWQFNAFVGTPSNPHQRGQIVRFSLEIDSGDTWIQQNYYNGGESTTFMANKSATFELDDLFGKVSGFLAQDAMNIIGSDYNFTGQRFGMITNSNGYRPTWSTGGKLGLAWPGAGSAILNGSLLNSLEPLERFTISFDQNEKYASYAMFGAANCQDCLDYWATVPLRGDLIYWQIWLLSLGIDDPKMTDISFENGGHQLAMISNRAQFIFGPLKYVEKLANNLNGRKNVDGNGRIWFEIDCKNGVEKMPIIVLNLEGNQYLSLSAKDYIKEINGKCILLFAPIENVKSEIYAQNVDWIFGLPLLRRYCQLYDIQNREMGFARAMAPKF